MKSLRLAGVAALAVVALIAASRAPDPPSAVPPQLVVDQAPAFAAAPTYADSAVHVDTSAIASIDTVVAMGRDSLATAPPALHASGPDRAVGYALPLAKINSRKPHLLLRVLQPPNAAARQLHPMLWEFRS